MAGLSSTLLSTTLDSPQSKLINMFTAAFRNQFQKFTQLQFLFYNFRWSAQSFLFAKSGRTVKKVAMRLTLCQAEDI